MMRCFSGSSVLAKDYQHGKMTDRLSLPRRQSRTYGLVSLVPEFLAQQLGRPLHLRVGADAVDARDDERHGCNL